MRNYKRKYIKENLDESTCEEIAREFTGFIQRDLDEYGWVEDVEYWQTSYGGCFECEVQLKDPADDRDWVWFHVKSITGDVKVKQTDGLPVASSFINKIIAEFRKINHELVANWFFEDDLYESRRTSRRPMRKAMESRCPSRKNGRIAMREAYKRVTQKYIKDAVRDFGAIDVTNYSNEKAISLKRECDLTVIAVSSGINGTNGALLKDLKTGQVYAITARNSVLLQLV